MQYTKNKLNVIWSTLTINMAHIERFQVLPNKLSKLIIETAITSIRSTQTNLKK